MVAPAETHKSPTQVFANRLERIFVPVIVTAVALLLFARLVIDEPVARSAERATGCAGRSNFLCVGHRYAKCGTRCRGRAFAKCRGGASSNRGQGD